MGEFINTYTNLSLNGICYNKDELLALCELKLNSNLLDWEQCLYSFILEWIGPSDYVFANTSGSTGEAKLIRLDKQHMIQSAKSTIKYFELSEQSNSLLPMSASYIAGKMMIVRAFVGGFNIDVVKPSSIPFSYSNKHYNFVPLVPMQLQSTIDKVSDDNNKCDCSTKLNADVILIGGAPLSLSLRNKLNEYNTKFYESYGMTETVSHVALKEINSNCFTAVLGVKFSVDERHCLVINAPKIANNTIVTNDVVELLNETQFVFIGRFDNVINSGGVKLMPETIEEKLSPILKEYSYALSSLPNKKLGSMLVLVIETPETELPENLNMLECSILDKIKQANILDKYEYPRELIFINSIPRTESGKIARSDLKTFIKKYF